MELGIAGKRALVVGASKGMGRAVAVELARAGCSVAAVARDAAKLAELRRYTAEAVSTICADAVDQPGAVVEQVWATFGQAPDIIAHVNGGSVGIRDHLLPSREWAKVWQANIGAAHDINRAFLPVMEKRGWGRIVHFSSNGTKLGTGRAPYVSAKHALEGYVQIMSREYSAKGVVITAVRPGPIETPGLFIYSQGPEWTKDFQSHYLPIGRWGRDEEVAGAVALLCSERASYMPGAIVDVDGGMR